MEKFKIDKVEDTNINRNKVSAMQQLVIFEFVISKKNKYKYLMYTYKIANHS